MIEKKRLRRGSGTTATAKATTELGSELAGGTTLLALTLVTATVLATVATGTATAATGALLAAEHAAGGSVAALLLDVGLGDDLGGEVEPLAEVVETLGGEAGMGC